MPTKKRKLNEHKILQAYEQSLEDMYTTHQIVPGNKWNPCADCVFRHWKRGDECFIVKADEARTHLCKTCILKRGESLIGDNNDEDESKAINVENERKRIFCLFSKLPTPKLRCAVLTILSESNESRQIASRLFPPTEITKTCTRCHQQFDPRLNSDTSCVLNHTYNYDNGSARGGCRSDGWDCFHSGCERCSPGIPEWDDDRLYHCSYKDKWMNSKYFPASVCFRGEHITDKFTLEDVEEISVSEDEESEEEESEEEED